MKFYTYHKKKKSIPIIRHYEKKRFTRKAGLCPTLTSEDNKIEFNNISMLEICR